MKTLNEERVAFLRDLAERLMHIPVAYGTDQYDVDRLLAVARHLDKPEKKQDAR